MRNFLTILCALVLLSSCASNRNTTSQNLNPDKVPSVDVSGKNLLAGVGKPIAKGKLKKKLKNAYKTLRLDKMKPQFSFDEDGNCAVKLLGMSLKGTYNYNPSQEKVTFKWHGIPMTARLKRSGKKKLHLTFDADKLLKLFSLASKVSDSSALKALSFLLDNYDDVMVGFELKK